VTGRISDAHTGYRLSGIAVNIYDRASGQRVGAASSNAAGVYRITGLPVGAYVAFTSPASGYVAEIYDNIPCDASCPVAVALGSGISIAVTGSTVDTTGIDFALDPRSSVPAAPTDLRATTNGFTTTFMWSSPGTSTASPATSYVLEAGVAPGTTVVSFPVNGTSFTVPGVPPGLFYIRVKGVNAVGTGPASAEYTLNVSGDGAQPLEAPTSVSAFMSGRRLTLTWNAPAMGGVPSGYIVEAGSASGGANLATLAVGTRSFTFNGVPDGFYFLRVRARTSTAVGPPSVEVMIVVGNGPTPPGPPSFDAHSVSSGTVALEWAAPALGTAASYVIEAGSATGLSNLAVFNTGTTALTASFGGVPSGTYYVRVRAVNALGASVVSNERTIVVP
jgi:predicted phage tail protein